MRTGDIRLSNTPPLAKHADPDGRIFQTLISYRSYVTYHTEP